MVRQSLSRALPLLLAASCARAGMGSSAPAVATLRAADGTQIGVLRLESVARGVRISGELTGLAPGAHGIHFHAVGRCEPPDFSSAGGHFNPGARKHGLANAEGPHAGDLPAIGADANGRAVVETTSGLVTLDSDPRTGLFDADGTAIVLHASPDDQHTDPSGNSGSRVACGTLRR